MRVCLCVCPLTCWQAIGWMNGRPLLEVRWHNRNNSADHSDLCLFPHSLRPVLMEARALFWGQQLDLSHCPLCPGTVTLTWCNWCLLLLFFSCFPYASTHRIKISQFWAPGWPGCTSLSVSIFKCPLKEKRKVVNHRLCVVILHCDSLIFHKDRCRSWRVDENRTKESKPAELLAYHRDLRAWLSSSANLIFILEDGQAGRKAMSSVTYCICWEAEYYSLQKKYVASGPALD